MISEKEYCRLKKAIRKVVRKNPDRRIVLFGAQKPMNQVIDILREEGKIPEAIIDNDIRKQHLLYFGVRACSAEEALVPSRSDTMIFTCSNFEREMGAQAMALGYKKSQIYNFYNIMRHEAESSRISSVKRGARLYGGLKKKYGQSTSIILCSYPGTGDIYLIGIYLNEFLKCHNIKDYVFVVISRACARVANIFEIKNIEQIGNDDNRDISNAYIFAPEVFPLYFMNDVFLYTNHIQYLRGYKGLKKFDEFFRTGIFDLEDDCKPVIPDPPETAEIMKFIAENRIDENTILVSPYSNTLAELQPEMWVKLAELLSKKGYRVFTNSGGESEPAIEGTEAVFFPLNQAIQILNHMGGFIGVRSGFCDVASAAKCKKIILYDESNAFFSGTALDYFSLNGNEFCNDAYEFTYKNDEKSIAELIDKIIDVITA